MSKSNKFLQIHFLVSYPSALINRDDAGFAKRIPFGGYVRTRISSQCLKRHWRTYQGENSLAELGPMSTRSRLTFEKLVYTPLVETDKIPSEFANVLTKAVLDIILGKSPSKSESEKSKGKKGAKEESSDASNKEVEPIKESSLETSQLTVLGNPEIEYLKKVIRETHKKEEDAKKAVALLNKGEIKKNLDALKLAAGLDAALFGRMVTSDILSRGDAAIHVAHAFTTHKESSEADYFTAVDDLLRESDELGSAHINTTELTSGLYYGYVVVDIPLLVSNLEGCKNDEWETADKTLAGKVVKNMINIIATVSPGAKLGSTAPHSHASMVMLEAGTVQPRTLANAFLKPVSETPDLLENSYNALAEYLEEYFEVYSKKNTVKASAIKSSESFKKIIGENCSLENLASWAERVVTGKEE